MRREVAKAPGGRSRRRGARSGDGQPQRRGAGEGDDARVEAKGESDDGVGAPASGVEGAVTPIPIWIGGAREESKWGEWGNGWLRLGFRGVKEREWAGRLVGPGGPVGRPGGLFGPRGVCGVSFLLFFFCFVLLLFFIFFCFISFLSI